MYSTCLFCHSRLGVNESIEHFPIGRRLAFDAARGRLWIVCRACERWNLTPLEERWEAIEECERLFSTTRMRVSTGNIGLARIREGLELVRIGAPQRPEMAAWRYGDQFGRRRRKYLLMSGAGAAAAFGLVVLGPMTGIIAGGGWGLWSLVQNATSLYQERRVRARLRLPEHDNIVRVRRKHLNKASLVFDREGWGLHVPFDESINASLIAAARFNKDEASMLLRGEEAIRAAGQLLPAINESGASRTQVADAVRFIEERPEPNELFKHLAFEASRGGPWRRELADDRLLRNLSPGARLALEMAAHEESERRALEGELGLLQAAWQEAEEVAAIADDMFVSDETRAKISELKSDS